MTDEEQVIITSTRNQRIVAARKLDRRKYRRRQGRFLVEGLQLLHMALDAGARPTEVFYCESLFVGTEAEALLARFGQTEAELVPVSDYVMDALSERENAQGIVATFALCDAPLAQLELAQGLVLVLEQLQDPGNVGTLIRTADAVGAEGVILIEPCADVFDPKVVRASMGSLFNLPIARTTEANEVFARLRESGLRAIGADVYLGIDWGEGLWQGGVALVLGNEARGLSGDVRGHLDGWAKLPMVGGAESLNVAVAGGVLMYAWLRVNFT